MVKKGRGKGKKPEMVFEGDVPPTAQLPEKSPDSGGGMGSGGAWSKQFETQLVTHLANCKRALEEEIAGEEKSAEKRRKALQELGAAIGNK
jgi:YEATS domain-containing protein 4